MELGNDGTEGRPAAGHWIAREPARHALEIAVIVPRADHRADRNELVHHFGHERQMLANLDAGNVRLDRLELSANLRRRIHLDVEHVLMWRPAGQVDHDDRLVRSPDAGLRLRVQQLRQGQPAQAQSADLDEAAPGNPVTESGPFAVNC